MRRLAYYALMVALLLALGMSFATADVLTWSITGTGVTGSGTLTVGSPLSPEVYGVTSMTGTFADTNNGINGVVFDPYSPSLITETSPDGLYYFDNLLDFNGGQFLDSNAGLLFQVIGNNALDGGEVNVAGGGTDPAPYDYQGWETTHTSTYLPSSGAGYAWSFNVSAPVPEPATMSLIGFALFGLGFRYHRKRKSH